MKIPSLFFFSVCIVMSCNETKHPTKEIHATFKSGTYTSAKFSKTDWLALAMAGYKSHALGMELTVNSDSTFKLKTCGAIETGHWKYDRDSLYLFAQTIRWKNDSLQQYGYKGKWLDVPKKPEVFCVNGNILKEDVIRKDGKTLNMLVLQK